MNRSLPQGTLVAGKYELDRLLGKGTGGEVYLARDRGDDSTVAVKLVTDERAIEWLKAEFKALTMVSHPNIPKTWDFCFDRKLGVHLISVEYIQGVPFTTALEGAGLEVLVDYTMRLCRAMGYVHQLGYIHCDIKPENVLIERDSLGRLGELKLLDFGMAVPEPREELPARGTIYYMAPEWFTQGMPSRATDIYSLGMLLYQASYGDFPFEDSVDSIIDFHLNRALPFPSESNLPVWWAGLIARLTAKDPSERPASCAQIIQIIARKGGFAGEGDPAANLAEIAEGGGWIGRSEVWDGLTSWLRNAMEPGSRAGGLGLLIQGGEGMGKTRLLHEIKRTLQTDGLEVMLLSPTAGTDVVVGLVERLRLASNSGHDQSGEASPARALDALLDEAVGLLVEASGGEPLILLFDDLDRMGPPGVQLMATLVKAREYARIAPGSSFPILPIGSVRSPVPAVAGAEPGDILEIPPMSRKALGEFLSVRFSLATPGVQQLPEELLEQVWAFSSGNPRAAGELVSWMQREHILVNSGTSWELDKARLASMPVPGDFEAVLRSAVLRLSPANNQILSALCALPGAGDTDLLSRITGLDSWEVEASLEYLADIGYLTLRDQGEDFWMENPLLRRIVREMLDLERWQGLHRRILESLSEEREQEPWTIAWHAFHAGSLARAGEVMMAGVSGLISRGEYGLAEDLLEIAPAAGCSPVEVGRSQVELSLLTGRYQDGITRLWEVMNPDRGLSGEARTVLLTGLAQLYFKKGDYQDALRMILAGEELAEGEQVPQLLALESRVHLYLGGYDKALDAADRVLGLGEEAGLARFRSLNIKGLVHTYRGEFPAGEAALLEAWHGLERLGTLTDCAFVLNSLGMHHQKRKNFDQAEKFYRDSLRFAHGAEDLERVIIGSMNLSVLLQETGHYQEAIEQYTSTLELAYRREDRGVLMRIYGNLGNIHRYLGILDSAAQWTERALALAEQLRSRLMIGLGKLLIGEVELFQGRISRARVLMEEALAILGEVGAVDEVLEARIDLGTCLLSSAEAGAARTVALEVISDARKASLKSHLLRADLLLVRIWLSTPELTNHEEVEQALNEARSLLDQAGTPELAWRTHMMAAEYAAGIDAVGRLDSAMAMTEKALADLEASVPVHFRGLFFQRRDRADLLERFKRLKMESISLGRTVADVALSERMVHSASEDLKLTQALLEMNRKLSCVDDLEQVLEVIVDTMIEVADAERGFVLISQKDRFNVVVARNLDGDAIRRSRAKVSRTIADQVLRTGERVVLDDAVDDDYFSTRASVMALRIRSIACLPLTGRQGVVGAIYLDNRFQPGLFEERCVRILDIFSRQAALAVENALLHDRNRKMLEELEASKKEVERLNLRLKEELETQRLALDETRRELFRRQSELEDRYHFDQIVGQSQPIRKMFEDMSRIARTDVSVLILGESGTGKELVAKALHYSGPRRNKPFVTLNCAALPENLLESELFGYMKGAFTGASSDRTGMFAAAEKGTLFLDEVGDMSPAMQTKLLRAIQEREYVPVGSFKPMQMDVRILAATNRPLEQMVKEGTFREDLYFRLNVVRVNVPPLRERREDIPILVEHFLELYREQNREQQPLRVDDQVMRALTTYQWPGNVRELQATVWTAAIYAQGGVLTTDSLEARPEVLAALDAGSGYGAKALDTVNLKELEYHAVIEALEKAGGNKVKAAKLLGISRRALYNKLEAFSIGPQGG